MEFLSEEKNYLENSQKKSPKNSLNKFMNLDIWKKLHKLAIFYDCRFYILMKGQQEPKIDDNKKKKKYKASQVATAQ